ncbi:hypothetical protein [Pseudomonas inefficax]|uniref:hypothetical protein n=1 Tax=Pseudomonas inefficax TaxID=2078786 RepID=UPI002DBC5772|nr:hypothetical protein [Pseudomonas sp. CMAA1741]MEC4561659.1 hypothetical protein [Pseudomonas sp. CMAA1741]
MSLNDFVVDALVHTPSYQNVRLWTVENHEKYSTLDQPELHSEGGNRFNHEIFLLMRALNEQGVGEEGLCADARGQGALKSVIGNVAERLAALSDGCRLHYVELGPEPIKSSCLLRRIAQASSSIRYTAIDINQTSEPAMSAAVRPIVQADGSFNYIAADYRTVTHDVLRRDEELTLITLLGFQEGNELPVSTGRLIRNLAGGKTYILSEMQVYEEGLERPILAFYGNPHMLQFSRMVALQQGFNPSGEHEAILVPLRILDETIHVAVTLQPVQRLQQHGYLLTNICLKYTPEQFRRIRARHCNCSVVDEFASGDGTVRYQIAKYLQ